MVTAVALVTTGLIPHLETSQCHGCIREKKKGSPIVLVICLFTYLFILLFRAAPVGYGSSQVRGPIGATPTSLLQSHSNVGSELHL